MILFLLDYFSRPAEDRSLDSLSAGQTGVVDISLAVRRMAKKPSHPDVKFILQIVLALAFVFGLFVFDSVPTGNTASLTLYIREQKRVFTGEVVPSMTVLDAINAAAVAGNIKFFFAIENNKTRIMNFGGLTSANILNKYSIFLNDQRLDPASINTVPVQPRDSVVMKILSMGAK